MRKSLWLALLCLVFTVPASARPPRADQMVESPGYLAAPLSTQEGFTTTGYYVLGYIYTREPTEVGGSTTFTDRVARAFEGPYPDIEAAIKRMAVIGRDGWHSRDTFHPDANRHNFYPASSIQRLWVFYCDGPMCLPE